MPDKITLVNKSGDDGFVVFGGSYLAVECDSYNAKVDKKLCVIRRYPWSPSISALAIVNELKGKYEKLGFEVKIEE